MATKKNKIIIAGAVIVIVFATVLAAGAFYLTAPQPKLVVKPFSFSLTAIPNNSTIRQGGNTTIAVEAACLDGNALPVMLSAAGGPNGTLYQFSNQTGTPTAAQPFNSYLTLILPTSTAQGSYLIDVSANSTKQVRQAAVNLTVVDAEIEVSGAVTINTQTTVSGVTMDVIPTDIFFTSTTTGQSYQAKIHRYTDTTLAPGKTGSYSISLPNLQSYSVDFYCFSFPHYIPVLEVAKNGIENGGFTVNCAVGVTSISANFTG